VKEHQIYPVPLRSEPQAILTGDEGEIVTQLQQELLEAINESILKIGFRILVSEIQKFENERVANMRVWG